MMLSGLLLGFAVFASTAAKPAAAENEPFLLQFTHATSEAAGIGRLSAMPIPSGATEIRVWVGFGVVPPDYMLRLRVDGNGMTTGELWLSFDSDLSYIEDLHERQRYRRELSRDCVKLMHGQEKYACRSIMHKEPDWSAVFQRLQSLRILTLPDESTLPPSKHVVSDGMAIVVEVRNDRGYRAYEYSNPIFREESEAKDAVGISKIVGEIIGSSGRKG